MTDYTPTTRDVRDDYREARIMGDRDPDAEFDRWLEQVKAEAWDEGHRTPQDRELDDCRCEAWYEHECACGLFGTGKIITPNPYRKETE